MPDLPGRRNYLLSWHDVLDAANALPTNQADLDTIKGMVTPNYGRNRETYNEKVANCFDVGMKVTSSLSMHQDADTEQLHPTQPFVDASLKAIDSFVWKIQEVTMARVGCQPLAHVAPHTIPWTLRPVQYRVSSSFTNDNVGLLLRLLSSMAYNSQNGSAYGLHPETAKQYICHLHERKADIMATLFGIQPKNHVSLSEHNDLLASIRREEWKEYGKTQPATTAEAEAEARDGVNIAKFRPGDVDWSVFAKIRAAGLDVENITQYGNVSRQPSDVPETNVLQSGPDPLGPLAANAVLTVTPRTQPGQRGDDPDVADPASGRETAWEGDPNLPEGG